MQFQDVTQAAGLRFVRSNGAFGQKWMPETMGGGGAFWDYDNDGWQDILLLNGAYWPGHKPSDATPLLPALYRNKRDGTFTDVTQAVLNPQSWGGSQTDKSFQAMGVAVGDFDNDGFDDLFITAVCPDPKTTKTRPSTFLSSRLLRNVPDGKGGRKIEDVTEASGIQDLGWPTSAAWLDYNGDGKLDLFVCHYLVWSPETDLSCGTAFKSYCRPQEYPGESCRLYENLGGGKFKDVTKQAGLYNPNSKALGVCVTDLDQDGKPDLIVANDMEPTSLYRNRGNGTFVETALPDGIAVGSNGKARAGMGIDTGDYANDDTRGLAIGNFNYEGLAFYTLGKSPPYSDLAKLKGLYDPSYPWITFGLFFADFDNDGWLDLFATNGHILDTIERSNPGQSYRQPALLYRNRADGTFIEIGKEAGVAEPLIGRGACRGDYDNDGKLDILLIPNVGPPRLLHNTTPTHHAWLTVRLVGKQGNRNGYGARVTVTANGHRLTREARSGSSYLSAHDNRLHFGLGANPPFVPIEVRWPSGKIQTWERLTTLNQVITLTEE